MESDADNDKDEETMIYEEKPTIILELGNDLNNSVESEEDIEDETRSVTHHSAPSIGHTQSLPPSMPRDLSPLGFNELLPSILLGNICKVGRLVVTLVTNFINSLKKFILHLGSQRRSNIE